MKTECSLLHVSKSYNEKPVLKDLSLEIEKGGQIVITGPSGCGKTTLLRLLMGLEQPDRGTVVPIPFAGAVFQEERFCEELSAVENALLLLRHPKKKRDVCRDVLSELLPPDEIDKPVLELSGGMRRRAALARAVLCEADVLILDEPFAGLDKENRGKCAEFLEKHRRGRTLIVVSHFPEDLPFCTRIELS